MSEYLVDIKNERLSFFTPAGEVKALNDVSIHLKEGEVLGIVGESGSGKSVTAYSLMGLTAYPGKLIGGTLEFNGHRIDEMTENQMRKIRGEEISIIFQDLDVTIQAQILELMMELKEKLGMAIIMITHDLGVVASMCDRIAVMYAGKVVEYGTTEDIFYNPSHEYTKGLLRSIPKLNEKEHSRLVPIEGSPVDMLNPPAGCPFAPRCDSCMKICLRQMPEYTDISDVHYSACWLLQKAEFEKAQGGKI